MTEIDDNKFRVEAGGLCMDVCLAVYSKVDAEISNVLTFWLFLHEYLLTRVFIHSLTG